MVQITVEDILRALDEANMKVGRLQLQRDGLLREIDSLSRRIVELTSKSGKDKKEKEK